MKTRPTDGQLFAGLKVFRADIDHENEVLLYVRRNQEGGFTVSSFLDILNFDSIYDKYYNSYDDLPEFVKLPVLTLSTLPDHTVVNGVGRKSTENTYWIVVEKDYVR